MVVYSLEKHSQGWAESAGEGKQGAGEQEGREPFTLEDLSK